MTSIDGISAFDVISRAFRKCMERTQEDDEGR